MASTFHVAADEGFPRKGKPEVTFIGSIGRLYAEKTVVVGFYTARATFIAEEGAALQGDFIVGKCWRYEEKDGCHVTKLTIACLRKLRNLRQFATSSTG